MTIADIQAQAWHAVSSLIPANPDAAIYQEWLRRKAGYTGPLGVPVSEEQAVDEGGTAQAFSSGAVVHWTGGDSVEVI